MPELVPQLVDLLRGEMELNVRNAIGQAIGAAGFAPGSDIEQKLFEKLKDPELRNGAALALIMGGNEDAAARTVAMYADFAKRRSISSRTCTSTRSATGRIRTSTEATSIATSEMRRPSAA